MKRGFTLLELIIVIIIIGVLAILGFTQYQRMVERARGAEARAILGDLRKFAYAYRMQEGTVNNIPQANLNLCTTPGQTQCIPSGLSGCQASHYFRYDVTAANDPTITITATRCGPGQGGKNPDGPAGGPWTLTLTSNLETGQDTWGGNGGY